MRLPANIVARDKTHCSLNCNLMMMGLCVARGSQPPQAELLKKDSVGGGYLRTDYCQTMASDGWVHKEKCPKCGGTCEGEIKSGYTYCLTCGTRFGRVVDQDETYLQEDPEPST